MPAGARLARWAFGLAVVVQLVALYWPRPVEPGTTLPVDKLVHAAVFGAVLWTGGRAGVPVRPLVAVLAVHAAASEVVQGTLLDRDGNVPDALADLAGLVVAWFLLRRGRSGATPARAGGADRG